MAKDSSKELKQLKRDYFELEETRRDERESLMKVINTFGVVASRQGDMAEQIHAVKEMIKPDKGLPLELIDESIRKIKDKVMANEDGGSFDSADLETLRNIEERLIEACRSIKRVMSSLLVDFYPLTAEMKEMADNIRVECKGDVAKIELKKPTDSFLRFLESLKEKISEDFRYTNRVFLILLEQVKGLEKWLTVEFGGSESLKEIEYFEIKINNEVGSIADSFNIYTTISEVKEAVVEKLQNIKSMVSSRKERETKRAKIAQENIKMLQERISEVEKDARKMSKKAKKLKEAATRDGLTGLYNRKAFDIRVKDALSEFNENDNPFSVVFFDVDRFKEINDKFGHIAGDKVLKKVAQSLRETFRKDDFMARYGGDEFAVVIDGLTKEMANERILNFKSNLKKRRFVSYKDGDIDINVSAGISIAMKEDTLESLIERADQAMYATKHKID